MSVNLENVNHFNYATKSGKVFCKRQNRVRKIAPEYTDCDKCPYLFGSLQGQGIECMWEDIKPHSPCGHYVYDPQEEYLRVSELIINGILKKG